MDTGNIIATFCPARGDHTTLSKSCLTTLDAIYRHPLSHNLEWADVIALFAKLGSVDHKSNNDHVFSVGDEHHLMHAAHGKDLRTDDMIAFRHMLTRAGWSPETARPAPPGVALPKPPESLPDLLVAIEHRQAQIYQLDLTAGDQSMHAIRPYDPHHFLHHLSHKDQPAERGQRVAEDLSFYARIAEALRLAGRIVVVGHGTGHANAGHRLVAYLKLRHKDIFQKLTLEVEADLSSLTLPQLLVLGRHSLSDGGASADR